MGPKQKIQTRQKTGDVGAPSNLPDIGSLFVNRDIIAAIDNELEKSPQTTVHEACVEVTGSVMRKFGDLNPALSLIPMKSVTKKMMRLHENSVKYKRKQMTPKVKENFREKLQRKTSPLV